jgi:hypothetical protein
VLESLVLRAGSVDPHLVLACCLVDSRGDSESHQHRAVLGLDGSSLHFILGAVSVSGGHFLVEDGGCSSSSLVDSPHQLPQGDVLLAYSTVYKQPLADRCLGAPLQWLDVTRLRTCRHCRHPRTPASRRRCFQGTLDAVRWSEGRLHWSCSRQPDR